MQPVRCCCLCPAAHDQVVRCCSTHMAPNFTDFPFPKDLMVKFVQQNNGQIHCLWHYSLRHVDYVPLQCKCSKSCPSNYILHLTLCCDIGYFPVVLETLPEGTCVHAHCPVFQVGRRAKHSLLSVGACCVHQSYAGSPCHLYISCLCRSQQRTVMPLYVHSWRQF